MTEREGWPVTAVLRAGMVLALAVTGVAASAQSIFTADRAEAFVQPLGTAQEFVSPKRAMAVRVQPRVIDLGEWVAAKAAPEEPASRAPRVAAARASAATVNADATRNQLRWQPSVRGGQVAALSFVSPAAYGLRMGVLIDQLPENALLRVYAQADRDNAVETAGQRVLQILDTNLRAGDTSDAARTWWTPGVDHDEITLEIELPPGQSTDTVRMAVPSVMHFYEDLRLPIAGVDDEAVQPKIGESNSCQLDVNCYSQLQVERNAVARMYYVRGNSGYVCSGTLVTDKGQSGTPYFITANHCIDNQTSASSLETSWFYRAPSCNARSLSPSSRTLNNGATLLYGTVNPDITLLRLNDTPPGGAVFAGWDSGARSRAESVVGIHHPMGDLQKISFGRIEGALDCTPDGEMFQCANNSGSIMNGKFYYVAWSQGMTEGGSSGSPLFAGSSLAGVLSGAAGDSCRAEPISTYGRFDAVYSSISKWLAGGGGGTNPNPDPGGGTSGSAQDALRRAMTDLSNAQPRSHASDMRLPVYSFYSTQTGAHFYTVSAAERDHVIATIPSMQYENTAFHAYARAQADTVAVHRFYGKQSGKHVFTSDEAQRKALLAQPDAFQYEGIAYHVKRAAED